MDISQAVVRIKSVVSFVLANWLGSVRAAGLPIFISSAVIVYLFYCLHAGQPMNEDYAVYLQQAWNIGHHVAMNNVGVIYHLDPAEPLSRQSPLTYPPLLPLLYAVPVLCVDFDLEFFKYLQFAILALSLLAFCLAASSWSFDKIAVSSSVILFGLSSEIARAVNDLGTDIPFILFLLLALVGIEKFVNSANRTRTAWGLVCGAAIFMAIDMRTVGIALVPTVLAADLIVSHWQLKLKMLLPLFTAVVLWLLQKLLLGDASGYGFVTNHRFFDVIGNLQQFYWALASPWQSLPYEHAIELFYVMTFPIAVVGAVREAFRGKAVALFGLFYAAMLLVLPNFDAGARYLIPLLLLHGAFLVCGIAAIARWARLTPAVSSWASTGLVGILALLLLFQRPPFPPGPLAFGAETASAQSTFLFIRTNTPSDAVVAFSKYRTLHLFTQRQTIKPTVESLASSVALLDWSRRLNVAYLVVKYSPSVSKFDFSDCPTNPLCANSHSTRALAPVFRNADFEIFRVPDLR